VFVYHRQLLEHFGLLPSLDMLKARCTACNGRGYDEISATEAEDLGVKREVFETIDRFWACRTCRKVFWQGPSFKANLLDE
jgi:uncharacterized protein with PIN domain